jgi:large subunit ribosomal protein L31
VRTDIHPEYTECRVVCSCGNTFTTRATVAELHVELCAECHPFYTGKQKLVDTGGRVERFERRYAGAGKPAPKAAPAEGDEAAEEEAAPRTRRATSTRKRPAPVAAKRPRPKYERPAGEKGERDERGERGGRGERGERGRKADAGKGAEAPDAGKGAEAPAADTVADAPPPADVPAGEAPATETPSE